MEVITRLSPQPEVHALRMRGISQIHIHFRFHPRQPLPIETSEANDDEKSCRLVHVTLTVQKTGAVGDTLIVGESRTGSIKAV